MTTALQETHKEPPRFWASLRRSKRIFTGRRRVDTVGTSMSFDNGQCVVGSNDATLMQFLQGDCPEQVLPKILAYCGPQQIAALNQTNKHWHSIIQKEATWKVLCEELYKWKPGQAEPDSWKELYRMSPCIPIDYSSITKALDLVQNKKTKHSHRSIKILLRPGKYWLRQAIDIQASGGAMVTFETQDLPKFFRPSRPVLQVMEQPVTKRQRSYRNLFSCRQVEDEESDTEEADIDDWIFENPPTVATLCLKSRKANEPVFRVRQGILHLEKIEIQHNSSGLDIWNGNAAVQIQPPVTEDDVVQVVEPRPTAVLKHVNISSKSGRGIVNIDGGQLFLHHSTIQDCAATGIYIGGPGSTAVIDHTLVSRNGIGNRLRRGIARGHSGIYLEQGTAKIRHSEVTYNTLTGISVVSPDNAELLLEDSALVNNGTFQIELPAPGTPSRQRSILNNNRMENGARNFR